MTGHDYTLNNHSDARFPSVSLLWSVHVTTLSLKHYIKKTSWLRPEWEKIYICDCEEAWGGVSLATDVYYPREDTQLQSERYYKKRPHYKKTKIWTIFSTISACGYATMHPVSTRIPSNKGKTNLSKIFLKLFELLLVLKKIIGKNMTTAKNMKSSSKQEI